MLFEHPHNNVSFGQSLDPVYFQVLDVEGDLRHKLLLVLFPHQQRILIVQDHDLELARVVVA